MSPAPPLDDNLPVASSDTCRPLFKKIRVSQWLAAKFVCLSKQYEWFLGLVLVGAVNRNHVELVEYTCSTNDKIKSILCFTYKKVPLALS